MLSGHTGTVNDVIWLPTQTPSVVSAGSDSTVRVWSLDENEVVKRYLIGHSSPVTHICSDPISGQIITGSYDGSLRLFDIRQHVNDD